MNFKGISGVRLGKYRVSFVDGRSNIRLTPSPSIAISPSVTPSISVSPSVTPSISISNTPSITPSISISPTPSITPSISISNTPSITPSISISNTPSVTPSISISATPSITPSISVSISLSTTPSISISNTPSITPSISISPTPSVTPTNTVSNTPSVTPSISISKTPSVTPSVTPSSAAGIISSGLILNYNINDPSSYPGSGTTVTDLTGSSNATLYNSPTYTSTGGGYLTFNGTDQYLGTNTALGSKLNPVNTSTVISIFLWAYPMDNGVIVSELGSTTPNSGWHDSQIEMVTGTLRFSVWQNTPGFASTISTPLNNWYYMGFTYNGTNLVGYVNGVSAVNSGTITRSTPGANLFYAIAAADGTSLGDGSYANMRFGGMQIYNTALSAANVLQNYNAQKSRFGL